MSARFHPGVVPIVRAAPFGRAMETAGLLMWTLVLAAMALTATGYVFYGPRTLLIAGTCLIFAAITETLLCRLTRRRCGISMAHSLAMGLIVGLMLPATAPWYVAATGAVLAVGVGKWLMGGMGHYPWNPAALAMIGLFLLWPNLVTPLRWPLLYRSNIIIGNGLQLTPLADSPALLDWATAEPIGQAVGVATPRADDLVHQIYRNKKSGAAPLDTIVRDLWPSWWDMHIGAVPGAIGQGSTMALLLVGLVLIWRGYLGWTVPIAVLAGAFLAAAMLPVATIGWWPIRYTVDGLGVGLAWAAWHTLMGPTLFAAVMLAGETVTRPMTRRSQVVYGVGVGLLTVVLRGWPVALLSGCWAVLAMNSLVPLMDRIDRRWRSGRTV